MPREPRADTFASALLGVIAINGCAALALRGCRRPGTDEQIATQLIRLQALSRVLLYPAVFLLAAGIFVGAVWANVSWGRYWGWDPKEVWALITLLIYALPMHATSLPAFRRPLFFHAYCASAFMAVLMTYFGVNYFLGGMHSYAGEGHFPAVVIALPAAAMLLALIWLRHRALARNDRYIAGTPPAPHEG